MRQFVLPNFRPLTSALTIVNRALYELSGGRLGAGIGDMQVLLLITRGRKSGKERKTPLLYVEDGDSIAVAASNFGYDHHPAWYLNVQANPSAQVRIGNGRRRVLAEVATPEEKERLWPRFIEVYRGYEEYTRRTRRDIPIVILRPESG